MALSLTQGAGTMTLQEITCLVVLTNRCSNYNQANTRLYIISKDNKLLFHAGRLHQQAAIFKSQVTPSFSSPKELLWYQISTVQKSIQDTSTSIQELSPSIKDTSTLQVVGYE